MFHEGTLQSGIALAIQQQKLVACFVRDESATSRQWEEEWLTSGWISSLLAQKAVLLRLEAGSTEAGFLAAFCDITSPPTFVVIQNGQLQTQLKKDVTQNEFINAIRSVLGASPLPGSSTAPVATSPASTPEPVQPPAPIQTEDDLYGNQEPQTTPTQKPTPANTKGKQKAVPSPTSKPDSTPRALTATQQAARDAVRKKKREEAEELARVKARIEADKAERKAQAEARKLEREREKNEAAQQDTHRSPRTTSTSTRGSQSQTVSLQVRLFDGRTIRSTFPRTASLEKEVRKWVDEEFSKLPSSDPNIANKSLPPYFFRHILSPQPSRELSAGDENQSLGDIDLAPSATLVLVPVKGYTEAYEDSQGGVVGSAVGTATGLVGGAFGILSSTIGYVGETLSTIIATGRATGAHNTQGARGQTAQTQQASSSSSSSQQRQQSERAAGPANEGPAIRVRTLADQRAREGRDQQFYNGNQLDTVPRTDDDDKRS